MFVLEGIELGSQAHKVEGDIHDFFGDLPYDIFILRRYPFGGVAAPSGATAAVAAAATRASDSLTISSRRSIYSTYATTP